jgi:hypothetical protein
VRRREVYRPQKEGRTLQQPDVHEDQITTT